MATANEELLAAALRHAVQVRRYSSSIIREMLVVLQQADTELAATLRDRLAKLGVPLARSDYTAQRLKALLDDIRTARAEAFAALNERLTGELRDFAPLEANIEQDIITAAVPVTLTLASIDLRTVRAIVDDSPFSGALLSDWFDQLSRVDQARIQQALTMGMVNGEGIDQIVARVVGTKAANFEDGVAGITRRNAAAIVRTAVNHVSNSARAEVWNDNKDIMSGERWTSTLDGRTSAICRARDGQVFPVGVGPRPPAHLNCRSIMVAVLDGIGVIGERPYVSDTRTRSQREVDFRADAKAQAGESAWKDMSAAERRAAIADARSAWADANIGRVPAATTYQEFLKAQSAAFQDEVLGVRKGRLFRDGGLTVQQFVDRNGNELTLDQLKALYPDAWARSQ